MRRGEQDWRCSKHTREFKEWCVDLDAYACHTCVFEAGLVAIKNADRNDDLEMRKRVKARRQAVLSLVEKSLYEYREDIPAGKVYLSTYARRTTDRIMRLL